MVNDDPITAAEMRALEQDAITSGRVTGLKLMERAGQGVVAAIFEEWPELATGDRHAVVLCGPGNNGGDGFVVARLLKDRGWEVEVYLYGDVDKLPRDARKNYDRWCKTGIVGSVLLDHDKRNRWDRADVAIDALFGTGLSRPLEDLAQVLFNLDDAADIFSEPKLYNDSQFSVPCVVAIDIPSGIHTDTGQILEAAHGAASAASANLTVTFHTAKLGHVLKDGPKACGKLVVKDIGL